MKKFLFVTFTAALFSLPGWAAQCTPGSLATYLALGPSGCVLGDITVLSFNYQAKASGGAASITADQIMVTPMLAPTATVGLQFAGPWAVGAGQSEVSIVNYRAISRSGTVSVQQARLDGNGFEGGNFSKVLINEVLATPTSTASLDVFLRCSDVCNSQTSASLSYTPSVTTIGVANQAQLQSSQGGATMSGFTNWFVTCAPCTD